MTDRASLRRRTLVVTADDFGLSTGVNRGILRAHLSGIVTSTSLMVNAPAVEAAAALACANPSLAVGLHFVLTFGRPVAPPSEVSPLLQPDGRFFRLGSGVHEIAPASAVRVELDAQIARFRFLTGRTPTHIDGHHHVHTVGAVRGAVIDVARELGVPVRAPDAATAGALARAGVVSTGHFIDRFYGEANVDVASFVAILSSLPEGVSELMCHPAEPDPTLEALSSYASARAFELETLTHPDVRRALEVQGIELTASRLR